MNFDETVALFIVNANNGANLEKVMENACLDRDTALDALAGLVRKGYVADKLGGWVPTAEGRAQIERNTEDVQNTEDPN